MLPQISALHTMARWSSSTSGADIPADVRQQACLHLVDTLGVTIAGSATRVAHIAMASLPPPQTHDACQVLGARAQRTAPLPAAFANGTAAHALDFDDNCYAGTVHGSAVIVPAALAAAQHVRASSHDLVTAFVIGSECEYALGAATQNVLYLKGWWTTGVLGPLGACAAAAWLYGLSAERTVQALSLAMVSAGGTKACFGTDGKALMAGRAASWGLHCAALGQAGATGAARAIESPNGFSALFNDGVWDRSSIEDLGYRWFLRSPGVDIKRLPVCLSSHAAVDAVEHLVQRNALQADDIASIHCDVPPMVLKNLVYDRPVNVQQSQFSMPFAIAVSLLEGQLRLQHLDAQRLQDPRLQACMAKVQMSSSATWNTPEMLQNAPEGANVTLRLHDGRTLKLFRATARGSRKVPLSAADMQLKFSDCTQPVLGQARSAALWQTLQALDTQQPLEHLFAEACHA